jgi:AraC-like DNA-binding protein
LNESRTGHVVGTVVAESFAVRASTATRSSLHAQHGVALFIGLEADVAVTDAGGARRSGRVMMVAPDVENAVDSPGATLGFMFDPEREPRLAGWSRSGGRVFAVQGGLAKYLVEAAASHRASVSSAQVLEGLAREASRRLARDATPRRIDRRVGRVLEALRDPRIDPRVTLANLDVSAAHLQALFVRDVGIPMRAFRLWRRLLDALVPFASGDATRAAHHAGFADLAHFSRTCRRMLGYSPTTLRNGITT